MGLSKSGVVILNQEFKIESQNLIKVKSRGAERLVDIERAFDFIIQPYRKEHEVEVFVEGYAYGAKYQRESLAELGGIIRRYLFLSGLDFWIVPPNSLKLFVTGTGRASKNYMKKCTKEKWNEIFKSDDVCDAYGLARLGMNITKALSGVQGYAHLPQNEREVIKEMLSDQQSYKNRSTAGRKKTRK